MMAFAFFFNRLLMDTFCALTVNAKENAICVASARQGYCLLCVSHSMRVDAVAAVQCELRWWAAGAVQELLDGV